MGGDNFYNGFRGPPQSLITTGIPIVGTGANDIPSFIFEDATYAVFSNGGLASGFPQTISPIVVQTTDSPTYQDEKMVTVVLPIGTSIPSGVTIACYAKYSRTWSNVGPDPMVGSDPPHIYQVWRFEIQGPSIWDPTIQHGFEQPPCDAIQGFDPIFKGFIDYILISPDGSRSATTAEWHVRMSLSHHMGCISHYNHPGVNGQPLTGASSHPAESFHLVAPAQGFNWLSGTTAALRDRLFTAQSLYPNLAGEVRSHNNILGHQFPPPSLTGIPYFECLTEYALDWHAPVLSVGDDCFGFSNQSGATGFFYYSWFGPVPPGIPPFSWAWNTTAPPPYPWVTENIHVLNPIPLFAANPAHGIIAHPFWRLELGQWTSSPFEWVDEIRVYACGGAFNHQDLYKRGNVPPFPDPDELAHEELQLVWGVTTDHLEQPLYNRPLLQIEGVMSLPTLMTDFANQLKHRDFYNGGPLPNPPQPWYGDQWVMSSLAYQISED